MMPFHLLNSKLAFLLALVGVLRVSELSHLHYLPAAKFHNAWILQLIRWKKNMTAGRQAPPRVVVPYFEASSRLCPVLCLETYLARSAPWRNCDLPALFISSVPPHHPCSKDSISRWLKQVLLHSGIDTKIFKSHSIRSASASGALHKGIALDQVLKVADWSSPHVFTRFYKRSVDSNFGLAVLASK
jgi:site-specific recombinase XerD